MFMHEWVTLEIWGNKKKETTDLILLILGIIIIIIIIIIEPMNNIYDEQDTKIKKGTYKVR